MSSRVPPLPQPEPRSPAATLNDRTSTVDDERVLAVEPLPPPAQLIQFFPVVGSALEPFVAQARSRVRQIVQGTEDRLLCVVGPCSVHDPVSALEYARRLVALRPSVDDALELVMRVYFEKPRTTVGWKGLINDPHLDGSFRINEGLRIARHLLMEINRLGLPCGGELLDTLSPQYMADLLTWAAIGARTTESQVHRELASGMSMAVGFKNSTEGNVQVAVDAILAAGHPHSFLGMHKSGQVATVRTAGNPDGHVILRGGREPNYSEADITAACQLLEKSGRTPAVLVDCSHGNSMKQHDRQVDVVTSLSSLIRGGNRNLLGVMIESHLVAGRQNFQPGSDDRRTLREGQSITDACLGWDDTVGAIELLAGAVRQRRQLAPTTRHATN